MVLTLNPAEGTQIVFYALTPGATAPTADVVPLYEFINFNNPDNRVYSTNTDWSATGYTRRASPVCLVWKNPMQIRFPVSSYQPRPDGTCCR
jgi:hypothetical protein